MRSIFRHFAEGEGSRGEARGEYVCRSKRKVRPSDVVVLREGRGIEELVQFGESNAGECHVIFERKSKKVATQREAGTLSENWQWIYNEHFYSSYDRAYFLGEEETSMRRILSELKIGKIDEI